MEWEFEGDVHITQTKKTGSGERWSGMEEFVLEAKIDSRD